jgi:hypothetical protein
MPGYIENALYKFQHKKPARPQHAPYPARAPRYGSKVQLTPELDTSSALSPAGQNRTQQVVGSLLYYGRAIDPTIVTAISELVSQQATTTDDTNMKLLQLIDYCASHPNSKLRYTTSDMILNIHSDAGYLNESKARSRSGGHSFFSSKPQKGKQQHNIAILTLSTILRIVVVNAAEAEIGAFF